MYTYCMYFIFTPTAVIPPPLFNGITRNESAARIAFGPATADRSERYISSFERRDLGIPLEVEFEKTQSMGTVGDAVERNALAPGAVYGIKIWSINGANFSYDPLVAATTLLYDTGKEIASIHQRHTYVVH